MKRLWVLGLLVIPVMVLTSLPAYAGDGCGESGCDGDCGMDVDIGVSGNSDVTVNTGENSEVDVNPGPCNDVFINGQDINEPTVIHTSHTKRSQSYSLIYSQRLSKLEYWRREVKDQFSILSDATAKLISGYENGNGDLEETKQRVKEISSSLESLKEEITSTRGDLSSDINDLDLLVAELEGQIGSLQGDLRQNRNYHLLTFGCIVGLVAATAVAHYKLSKRKTSR